MADLFSDNTAEKDDYDASAIEVLEGLEPVRKRPGMYIGGTDERALHHLVGEILDNAMDEAVAGHANRIEISLAADDTITITDNGRGIPIDEHPKFPGKSALEVILTTLHSGGKFSNKAYATSGGLHGVGISVVNALSDRMSVEVARDKKLYKQSFSRGLPQGKIENLGSTSNRRGTSVAFHPDPEIFGEKAHFKPAWLHQMARSKAYLFSGVEIRWKCDPALLGEDSKIPAEATFHFPGGLHDYLQSVLQGKATVTPEAFYGKTDLPDGNGRVEFAITWPEYGDGLTHSYCNTIPTPQGGTHESGLRTAMSRGIRQFADMVGNKKAGNIIADDVVSGAFILLSVFISDPQFQGQTKEKLASAEVSKWVDTAIKDYFDHWLSNDPATSNKLLEHIIAKAEERIRKRDEKATARKALRAKCACPESSPIARATMRMTPNCLSLRVTARAAPLSKRAPAIRRPFCPCAGRY